MGIRDFRSLSLSNCWMLVFLQLSTDLKFQILSVHSCLFSEKLTRWYLRFQLGPPFIPHKVVERHGRNDIRMRFARSASRPTYTFHGWAKLGGMFVRSSLSSFSVEQMRDVWILSGSQTSCIYGLTVLVNGNKGDTSGKCHALAGGK